VLLLVPSADHSEINLPLKNLSMETSTAIAGEPGSDLLIRPFKFSFPQAEQPALFVNEMRAAFRSLRKNIKKQFKHLNNGH
jgi:hypothetical protein